MSLPVLKNDDRGAGLPVVLIHGFPLSRKMWAPQVQPLLDAGYRVICPDLPGFGGSTPLAGVVSISRYADAVVDLLDQLGVEEAVVGGMSMGGYVLLDLAERYSDRLLGAMFIVTRAAADDEAGKEKRSLLAGEVKAGNGMIVPDTFEQVLFAPQTVKENPGLVREVRQIMESTPAEGLVGGLLAMRDREDSVASLPSFNMPALVLGAEQDLAIPEEHTRTLANGLPNAQLEVLPAAGHMANLEQPEFFNQVLLKFLATLG